MGRFTGQVMGENIQFEQYKNHKEIPYKTWTYKNTLFCKFYLGHLYLFTDKFIWLTLDEK